MEKDNVTPSATGTEQVVRTAEETVVDPIVVQKPTEAKAPETKKGRKVEIDADVLDTILKNLATLKEGQTQFEATASQDQIRKIEAMRASGKLVKSVKLRFFDGKVMLGYRMTKNNVWVSNGKLNEEQEYEVFFEDGETRNMTLGKFATEAIYKSYEVISEAKTQAGDVMFTVMMDDGKEVVINSKYVN